MAVAHRLLQVWVLGDLFPVDLESIGVSREIVEAYRMTTYMSEITLL